MRQGERDEREKASRGLAFTELPCAPHKLSLLNIGASHCGHTK